MTAMRAAVNAIVRFSSPKPLSAAISPDPLML
jgi:hypothetical protein